MCRVPQYINKDFRFKIVYTGKRLEGVFPMLYALLPDKSQQTYEKLFNMIKEAEPEFAPGHCDFEIALMNALEVCCKSL